MIIKNITGTIDSWFTWQVQTALEENPEDEMTFVITSQGGSVADAIAISDMLARHGKVNVEFSGISASAATWLAFGANRVTMHEDTLWLCHQCSTPVVAWENMNADELDSFITKLQNEKKSLEVIDAIIAKKYLDRCSKKGKNLKDVRDLMKEERYLAPTDCLEWGFVDEVLPTKASNIVTEKMLNAWHFPASPIPAQTATAAEPSFNEDSLINRIIERLKSYFNAKPKEADNVVVSETNESKPLVNIVMNKNFKFINAILGVEGVDEAENKVTLTVDQLKAIEDQLATANKAEQAMDAISDRVKNISGIENKANAIALMLDRIPVGAAVTNKPAEANNDVNSVEVENGDEVNEFVKSLK